jgi:hypothetical protein
MLAGKSRSSDRTERVSRCAATTAGIRGGADIFPRPSEDLYSNLIVYIVKAFGSSGHQ